MCLFNELGYTPKERMYLFYFVCVFARTLVAYLSSVYQNHRAYRPIVIIASLIGIYLNLTRNNSECVWWRRDIHLLFCLGILWSTLNDDTIALVPYLLFADVLFGLVYSIVKRPF